MRIYYGNAQLTLWSLLDSYNDEIGELWHFVTTCLWQYQTCEIEDLYYKIYLHKYFKIDI